MKEDEKMQLADRAEQWLENYPKLMASVKSWADAPVKDFDEGLLLCSCLRSASSFIENARLFEVRRCMDMIQRNLKYIVKIARPGGPRTVSEKKTKKIKAYVPKEPQPDEDGKTGILTEVERLRQEQEAMDEEMKLDKYRPQNLESYIHLLPKDLQAECRQVQKKYYMPLREYRTRLESLAENPDASKEQRAEMANKLVKAEEDLAAFWEQVDKAYKSVTGQEVPEDPVKEKKLYEYTKAEIDVITDAELKQKLTEARIENNKKYLRRTDLPDTDETRQQLSLRASELVEWGVSLTRRQINNMTAFKAELPKSYVSSDETDDTEEPVKTVQQDLTLFDKSK